MPMSNYLIGFFRKNQKICYKMQNMVDEIFHHESEIIKISVPLDSLGPIIWRVYRSKRYTGWQMKSFWAPNMPRQ